MADTAAPAAAPKATKPKVKKPAKVAEHPSYKIMVAAAITALKERSGSSRQAVLKYVMANYKVGTDAAKVNVRVKNALKAGVKSGDLKQAKGTGAQGSFKVEKPAKAEKPKAKKVKKPKAAAKKSPKKVAKKTAAKKPAKSPKKAAAKKTAVKKGISC